MTREQLDAIRARVEAATPGPWEAGTAFCCPDCGWVDGLKRTVCPVYEGTKRTHTLDASDAKFIAAARQDVPALLAEVERLTADPLPAAAWVREVERAAFARGVAAMREAAAGWFVNDIEHASSKAHDAYQVEAHRRGDVRHADAYEDLSDATKEWDRVLCRWAAATIRALPDPEDKS